MERYNHGILRFNDECILKIEYDQGTDNMTVTRINDVTGEETVISGGANFFDLIHVYEAMGDGTASLSIDFGETLKWSPQFIAFIAEKQIIIPEGENAMISGAAFRAGERVTSGELSVLIPMNAMYPNGNFGYWTGWGKIDADRTHATVNLTRTDTNAFFQNGQKFKVIVFETTDLREY